MRAIVADEYGGPVVLKYENVPLPEAKEDQILVREVVAGVNPVYASIRSGRYANFFGTRLPLVRWPDIAGIVQKAANYSPVV